MNANDRALERLSARLGAGVSVDPGPRPADRTATIEASVLAVAAEEVMAAGFSLATTVALDDTATSGALEMLYVFEPTPGPEAADDVFLTLRVPVDPARPELPSVTPGCPAAAWHEREAHDLMGIVPVGHPDLRPLVVHDGWPEGVYPLRKSFDAACRPPRREAPEFEHLVVEGHGITEVPVGPIHAGIIEPGHFRIQTVGDVVLHFEARLFYTHRGLEKRCEGRTAVDALHIAERTCGVCSMSHALGFCEALEVLAGIDVPARARALRTVALELERLYNHIGDVANICAGAALHLGNAHGLIIRERLQRLNEELSGSRFLRGIAIPGGVALDVTPALVGRIHAVLRAAEVDIDELAVGLDRSPSLLDRLDGTGVLRPDVATAWCAAGVAARASGVPRDARRDHPHAAYVGDPALFELTTTEGGDVRARLVQRFGEARVSLRVVRALLDGLPQGPLAAAFPERLPPRRTGISAIETPRGEAVHWIRSDADGRIDRWRLRSPSYANWPVIAFSLDRVIVPDFPLVNKSFELCYSCTDR